MSTAIETAVAEYQRHQSDPERFLALHTEHTAMVNIAGRRVLGKPALTEAMTAAMATSLARVRTSLEIEDIRFVRPDVALVSAIKHVHDERPDAERPSGGLPGTGAITLLLSREDGDWKVALAQTTPRAT